MHPYLDHTWAYTITALVPLIIETVFILFTLKIFARVKRMIISDVKPMTSGKP